MHMEAVMSNTGQSKQHNGLAIVAYLICLVSRFKKLKFDEKLRVG